METVLQRLVVRLMGDASDLIAVFNSVIEEFKAFNQAMTQSLAIMNATVEESKQMASAALELGKTSLQGPTALAKSYYNLASAGYTAKESIALLPVVSKFATAGMFDLSRATTLLADAQASLGLNTGSAAEMMLSMARVADVLARADALANASIKQFSEALSNKAGAAIKSLNKDVEEGVAVLAAFANQGIKGQEAGTLLSQMVRYLQQAYIKAGAAQKMMGLEIFDSSGKMKNFADIVANLEQIMGGLSDESKASMLKVLGFEARFQHAILPLLGTSKQIREFEAQLRRSAGYVDEVAAKQMMSLTNQIKLMWNELEVASIKIGQFLGSAMYPFIAAIKFAIVTMAEFIESGNSWIVTVPVITTSILLLAQAFMRAAVALRALVVLAIANPLGVIFAVGAVIVAITAHVAGLTTELGKLNEAQQRSVQVWEAWNRVQQQGTADKTKAIRDQFRLDPDSGKKMLKDEVDRVGKQIEDYEKKIAAYENSGWFKSNKLIDEFMRNPNWQSFKAAAEAAAAVGASSPADLYMKMKENEERKKNIELLKKQMEVYKNLRLEMEKTPEQIAVRDVLKANKFLEDLQEKAENLGLREYQKEIKNLEQSLVNMELQIGMTEGKQKETLIREAEKLKSIIQQSRAVEYLIQQGEANVKLEKQAEELREKYRTKEQKYLDEVNKIKMSKLTAAEQATALKILEDEYNKVGKEAKKAREEIQKFDAVLFGSAEAATRLAQYEDMMRIGMGDSLGPVRGATVWGGKVRDEKRIAQERKVAMSEVFQGQFDDPRFLTELKKIREGTDKLKDTKAVRLEAVDLA